MSDEERKKPGDRDDSDAGRRAPGTAKADAKAEKEGSKSRTGSKSAGATDAAPVSPAMPLRDGTPSPTQPQAAERSNRNADDVAGPPPDDASVGPPPDAAPADNFYFNSRGERLPLHRSANEYAVRYRMGERSDSPALSGRAQRLLRDDSEHVSFLAHYGLQVYKLKQGAVGRFNPGAAAATPIDGVDRALRGLEDEQVVSFVAPMFRRPGYEADPILTTKRFLVEFNDGVTQADVDALNADHNVRLVERLAYAAPALGLLLEAPSGSGDTGPIALSRVYFESGMVRYAVPDLIQRRQFRGDGRSANVTRTDRGPAAPPPPAPGPAAPGPAAPAPAAPAAWTYEAQQWHLAAAGVVDAWASGTGASGIVVAISDDGFDVSHPELAAKVVKQFDFENNIANATPKLDIDNHGTACAGVAVAAGVNARGAAPGCKFMAVRCPAYLGSADEGRMFQWMADNNADVISCSWGPPDGGTDTFPVPDNVASAINYCATRGRGGKGIPIFWAAGNGNELITTDGYASNPDVMAIAASTDADTKAYYSDFGPEIFAAVPSSGRKSAGERRVFTIDRRGAAGYNAGNVAGGDAAGDYTNDFGGTSAAAPLAAGIAALVISANPALTRDAVRDILKQTADRIGPAGGYDAGGHSAEFGYGRLNAAKAVAEAIRRAGVNQGGAPAPAPAQGRPQIVGPSDVQATAGPPVFAINAGANRFWAVELATQPELFDTAAHQPDRTIDNFDASWSRGALAAGTAYTPPPLVWARLITGGRVFYRVLSSSRQDRWANPLSSTSVAEAAAAPSVVVHASHAGALSIQGPPTASRSQPPPVFAVHPGAGRYYAVEVATDANLFNRVQSGGDRNDDNFYASWSDEGLTDQPDYQLPAAVWSRLKFANQLWYRTLTSASQTGWVDPLASVSDSHAADAPFIALMDAAGASAPLARRFADDGAPARRTSRGDGGAVLPIPEISGPERYERMSPLPPSFLVHAGAQRYFGVEVTSDPSTFTNGPSDTDADASVFFASWRTALLPAGLDSTGAITYVIPAAAWQALKDNATLYYRAVASARADRWADATASFVDGAGNVPPAIVLSGAAPAAAAPAVRGEERQWRDE